jgi:hypothetical protein
MLRSQVLRKLLKGVNVELAFGVTFGGSTNKNVFCPFHENEESVSKSCSVSLDGLFNCKGCGEKGDVFDFISQVKGITRDAAIQLLHTNEYVTTVRKANKPTARLLKPEMVEECVKRLSTRKDFYNYLIQERGLTPETIKTYKIGCDEYRITIPVYDKEEQLVNLRRYSQKTSPKMLSFAEGYGALRLFPLPQFLKVKVTLPIILCEGEWDCLLLRQFGYNAITVTGGVTSWNKVFNEYFENKKVFVVFDVHDKDRVSELAAAQRAIILKSIAKEVRIVTLDLPDTYIGGDVTDYFVKERRTREHFESLLNASPICDLTKADLPTDTPTMQVTGEGQFVPLSTASHSRYYYKKIKLRCLVAGKGTMPYLPPKDVTLKVLSEDGSKELIEHIFDIEDGSILSLIQCSTLKLHAFMRNWFGISKKAEVQVQIKTTFNIEEIFLIPAIDLKQEQGPYVIARCFYVGHGIQTNRVYEFNGYTLPNPKDQSATHILTTATPAETDIDTFDLSTEELEQLKITFQTDNVDAKLEDISIQLSEHITKIYGRPDLHIAVDLVFHSPITFIFDDMKLKKGWLEVLILGDTRTGKGYVTEGLCNHYSAGEVISGESLTLAGLVGGVQHMGDKWVLTWGKLPLADRRLIVMDEAGALNQDEIAKLSRIRSEGVAEITKIVSEKTTARTRIIWLANPRPKTTDTTRVLADYNYGIEAVPELIGAAEDVARFDYVINVAHNDVPSEEINRPHQATGELEYSSHLCHNLVMWVWSRKAEQVVFDQGVVVHTMKVAQRLADQFTSKIPLIQIEDVRFKLARIGCAAAGRTFSSPDGEILLVKKEHIDYAYKFLKRIYAKPMCGYLQLSAVEKERQTLKNAGRVKQILEEAGEHYKSLIDGLLEHRQITARDLCDYASLDVYQARSIISELVRLRALVKEFTYYIKKPAFKDFLRVLKRERN